MRCSQRQLFCKAWESRRRRSAWCITRPALASGPSLVEGSLGTLPISPVEFLDGQLDRLVEAIGVDAPSVGMAAWLVETLHAADFAKEMLSRAGAKAITGQAVSPSHQLEILVRHHDMQEAGHRANRAIAVERGHG